MIRYFALLAAGVYLGAGLFVGVMIKQAVPAVNPLGVAYIAVLWPVQIACARKDSGCDPTPPRWVQPYVFSFPTRG